MHKMQQYKLPYIKVHKVSECLQKQQRKLIDGAVFYGNIYHDLNMYMYTKNIQKPLKNQKICLT